MSSRSMKVDGGRGRRGGRGSMSVSPPRVKMTRSRSRSLTFSKMDGRQNDRYIKYSVSRSRSRERKPYRGNKYGDGHRRASYSRSRSPYRRSRTKSRSPMSNRKRHIGDREHPAPSCCLGVFGLSSNTTEADIYNIFSKYGPVDRVVVVTDAKTKCAKGFCFVYFCRLEDATTAKEHCSGMTVNGRIMRVDYSITKRAHTPTPGIYMGRPTHLRKWEGPRDRRSSYNRGGSGHRRSRSPYHRRRAHYNRSRSRSFSPRSRY